MSKRNAAEQKEDLASFWSSPTGGIVASIAIVLVVGGILWSIIAGLIT